jgi:hypothetical protein
MSNITSQHILNTSTNLLGFCLIVITSLHLASQSDIIIINELTSLVAILLTFSCIFSFISIQSSNQKIEFLLEKIANSFYIFSLLGILIIILLITFHFLK